MNLNLNILEVGTTKIEMIERIYTCKKEDLYLALPKNLNPWIAGFTALLVSSWSDAAEMLLVLQLMWKKYPWAKY